MNIKYYKRSLIFATNAMIIITLIFPIIAANTFENIEVIKIKEPTSLVPDLVYYPMSYDFGNVVESQTYQTTFQIWNAGTGTLTWNLGIVHTWISPSPTSGDSDGVWDGDTVVVTIDTTGLSLGSHSGFVSISANDGGGLRYFNIYCTVIVNSPPGTPTPLSGPSTGTVASTLIYTTSATDPNDDPIKYGIDLTDDYIVDSWGDFHPSGATVTFHITFYDEGTFNLRLITKDIHGAESGWSSPKTVIISTSSNNPPNKPNTPTGPSSGTKDISYQFSTSTTDPDGDQFKYGWDWNGDDIIDEWSELMNNGTIETRTHTWSSPGTYNIQVLAEDEQGARSDFSMVKTIIISSNNPPMKPSTPSGPPNGKSGNSYSYSTISSDSDGDNIYYLFDWGDETDSGWIGPYEEGTLITSSHIWSADGTFSIKVKSKDEHNAESVWSDPLTISMPKNTYLFNNLIYRFISSNSRLALLINQLLE